MKRLLFVIVMIACCNLNEAFSQWNASGNNIYNTNSGNVGIGNSSPTTLFYVAKNMTEPTITVHNLGSTGGATYSMLDDVSGANWKFKATNSGGFKIRDHATGLDVFFIEQNCAANLLYLKSGGHIGIGTSTPSGSALVDMSSTTKGFLPPRMTYAELTAISSPAEGLVVYCSDCGSSGTGAMALFMGGVWHTLSTSDCLVLPLPPAEGTHVPSETQIIWNWNAVTGSSGYKWNTTDNYTTAEDMGTSTSKTENGLTPNTPYTRYVWADNACGNSSATALTSATTGGGWVCGDFIIVNHVEGAVAPVTKTTTYGTVTNIPGELTKCWITSNLGSDHQATAVNDATEESAGWYWQFNRQQGYKHTGSARTPNTTWISSIDENSDWLSANDPCTIELGSGWRLPTYTEYYNIDDAGGWIDWDDPWDSALKMHAAGYLEGSDGSLGYRGGYGYYWSSKQAGNSYGWYMIFYSGDCGIYSTNKATGSSARCLRD